MPVHAWPDGRTPVLLSAHTEDLLPVDAAAIDGYLHRTDAAPVEVAATLARLRRVRRHRVLIRAADAAELRSGLAAVRAGDEHPLVSYGTEIAEGRTAFVFPGQGSQWPGMGAEPYATLPAYRAAADECAAAFTAGGHPAPLDYLTGTGTDYTEVEVEGAQFTHHVGLAAIWRAAGVLPDVTIGHSLGEIAAAYLAGTMCLADAVTVLATRAGVTDRLSGGYAVAALGIGAADARELIAQTPGWLELSVINGPTSVAISGDRDAVLAAVDTVRGRGGFGREITVNFPVHTSILESLQPELAGQWPSGEFADSPVQFIGGATGAVVAAGTGFADYWYTNLRQLVRFDRAVTTAGRHGVRVFVEMSAHPALLFAMTQVLGDTAAVVVGSGRRGDALPDRLAANLAAIVCAAPAGVDPTPGTAPLRGFPNAPMRPVHLWAAPAPAPEPGPSLTVGTERWREIPQPQHTDADGTLIVRAPADLDDPDPQTAAATLAALVDGGLLDYAAPGPHRRVCLVTVHAEQLPGDPPPRPGHAALAAMHRSLRFEHPDVEFTQLDLPAAEVDPTVVEAFAASGPATAALRTRDGRPVLLARDFGVVTGAEGASARRNRPDEVVITGGSGALGLHYARALAEQGARRIVLLSRRGTDAGALSAPPGVEMVSVPCDITDPDAVAAAAHGRPGAALLIHAAGAAAFAPAAELDANAVAHNCAAKITGLTNVLRHWPLRDDGRILLCSSVSGLWGGRGHAGYAAANRILDTMAAQQRAAGRDCTAVRWGLWPGPGVVDAAEAANITRSGLLPMDPDAACAAGLAAHPGDPLIYTADAARLAVFLGGSVGEVAGDLSADNGVDAATAVRAELATVLSLDASALDLDASLFDLGVDSLLAVDLRKRLRRRLGRTVPLSTLLGGVTGSGLVSELDQQKVNTGRD